MGQLPGLQRFKDKAQLKAMNWELAAAQRRDRKAQRGGGRGIDTASCLCGQSQPWCC
jgi:hypothetical protein